MTNAELAMICTMLNALAVTHGYIHEGFATYAKHIAEGRISCIGIWQLRDELQRNANSDSVSYKRGEALEELGIYDWYIPTQLLLKDYVVMDSVSYYDLADYVLTDHWRIEHEYQAAKQLEAVTC